MKIDLKVNFSLGKVAFRKHVAVTVWSIRGGGTDDAPEGDSSADELLVCE